MNAAAYVRYSSDNQREESIEAQLRAIREYAAREGHIVVKVYADEAKSATTDNRPEFQHMMADATAGLFEAVIVHKLDRFSRDRYDSAHYKRLLKRNHIRLISVLENLDGSPESIVLESVLEGMAEYYSRNLAREVMKGMKETAYECKHAGGIPPLGYDVAPDKTYLVNEGEAEAVRLIFGMYADGSGFGPIIEALNARGFKTKAGKSFGKNSLHEILINEKYAGVYVFNRTERKSAGVRNGHKAKPDDEIIRVPGGIPAIVTQHTWDLVRARMSENKIHAGAHKAHVVYLLSGRVFCGKCEGAMVGKTGRMGRNKTLYSYYECSTRKRTRACDAKPVNCDYLEQEVICALYDHFFAPDVIGKTASDFYKTISASKLEIPDYLKDARKKRSDVERKLKRMVDAIADGMYTPAMKDKMAELEASRAALEMRISEAERELESYNYTEEQIRDYLAQYSGIKEMEPEAQKKAVELFVERVVVGENNVNIAFTFNLGRNIQRTARKSGGSLESGRDSNGGGEGS